MDFAVMAGVIGMPFFIFGLGYGPGASGGIGAAQAISYAVACLLSARFVGRVKNGLAWAVLGGLLYAVLGMLIPFFSSMAVCATLAVVASIGLAFVWPALHSWVGAEPDLAKRGRSMSRFNIAWSAGFAVSPLLAGPVCDLNYHYPFILSGITAVLAVVLIMSLPHEKKFFDVVTQAMLDERAQQDRASEAHLLAAWCANLISNILISATRMVFPKRIDELVSAGQLRLLWESQPAAFLMSGSATKYSWLAFTLSFVMMAVFLWMGRTRWWHHRFAVVVIVQALAALAFWTIAHTHSLVLMLTCFMLIGINGGAAFFSAIYYSMANPALKHRRAAINEGAVGIGGFIGSMSFGMLAQLYGTSWPFIYAPIIIACGILAEAMLVRHGLRRYHAVEAVTPSDL